MHTVIAGGAMQRPAGAAHAMGLVSAFLARHNTGMTGHDVRKPLSTIVGKGCTQGLVALSLNQQRGSAANGGQGDLRKPLNTIMAGGRHQALVAAFLATYYGAGGQEQDARDPLHTIPTKARFSAVTVTIDGESYAIADIGMRMLTPRELFRAQGFPDSYIIDPEHNGKPLTKTAQTRMAGNSVCPDVAEAVVRANLGVNLAANLGTAAQTSAARAAE